MQQSMSIKHGTHAERGVSVRDVVGSIVAQSATVVEGHCVILVIQITVVQVCTRLEHRIHSIRRQIRTCKQVAGEGSGQRGLHATDLV